MSIDWISLAKLLCAWLRSVGVVSVAWMLGLPGTRFGYWMLFQCPALFHSGQYSRAWEYARTPVACTRFFEFDFVARFAGWQSASVIYDVSCPRALSLYCARHLQDGQSLTMMNPDAGDIAITQAMSIAIGCGEGLSFVNDYASAIPQEDGSVDVVWCVSVIEHIPIPAAAAVLQEMQRVLKPGGRLLLTTNVDKCAWDEYREENTYNLSQNVGEGSGFFFQRWYDEASVTSGITDALPGMTLTHVELHGEKTPGWFASYTRELRRRWAELSRNDPVLMARHFTRYATLADMPGQGVCCMCFVKKSDEDK